MDVRVLFLRNRYVGVEYGWCMIFASLVGFYACAIPKYSWYVFYSWNVFYSRNIFYSLRSVFSRVLCNPNLALALVLREPRLQITSFQGVLFMQSAQMASV